MLFMNIARKFGRQVYQEEAGAEAGSPAAAAPAGEAAATPGTEPGAEAAKPAPVTLGEPGKAEPGKEAAEPGAEPGAPDATGMQEYIDKYSEEKPALGLALGFLRDAGVSVTDPAFQLAEVEGDFSLLEAVLATKDLPGKEHMLGILKQEVAAYQEKVEAFEAETTALVQGILGEQHEDVLAWARETASDEEKEAFNNLFDAGGVYARAAATLLKQAYGGSNTTIPAKHAVETSSQAAGGNAPLTARDYASEVAKLAKEVGGDPRGTQAYQNLGKRREAGRKRGI